MIVPLCAQSIPEVAQEKQYAGFWGFLVRMFSSENSEARQQRAQVAEFNSKLRWSRNLADIHNQIQSCKQDKRCKDILSLPQIKQAVQARREGIIEGLNKSVNDLLGAHGRYMFFDFHKGINTTDEQGNTALHYAMLAGVPGFAAKWLIENGANVDAFNKARVTPLMLAAEGRSDLVSLLLQRGADANLTDKSGNRAIDRAREMLQKSQVDTQMINTIIAILQAATPIQEKIEYVDVRQSGD
jgi:hypothetical protein